MNDNKDNQGQPLKPIVASGKFKIGGVFLNSALKELKNSSDVFIDVKTLYNLLGDNLGVYGVYVMNEPRNGYIFNDEYKKMSQIVKTVNDSLDPNIYNKREEDRFRCDLVENLQTTKIVGLVMTAASVFICFIILIISIGSVANSIIISVDKNKRFLGVMMAVGLNKGGVRRIVQYEALTVIIIAIYIIKTPIIIMRIEM
jgi:ABC-type antimicrobial peptide transport system permease subunit